MLEREPARARAEELLQDVEHLRALREDERAVAVGAQLRQQRREQLELGRVEEHARGQRELAQRADLGAQLVQPEVGARRQLGAHLGRYGEM